MPVLTGSAEALRRQAEKTLQQQQAKEPERLTSIPAEEIQLTLHELQVHQIELEIQNEELRRVQVELDATRARYFDLYDLAPIGYCTISEQGLFLEANLTASTLLGINRGALKGKTIFQSILNEDQEIYYLTQKTSHTDWENPDVRTADGEKRCNCILGASDHSSCARDRWFRRSSSRAARHHQSQTGRGSIAGERTELQNLIEFRNGLNLDLWH